MASQPGYGRQFDKVHAVTQTATAAVTKHRFTAYNGAHAPAAPANGGQDSQGVAEESAAAGEAFSIVTGYSYLVEASAAIALFDYVKPAADGSGRAAPGALADHCGRALGIASAAGQLVEVQIVRHTHA
ncbi:capsid cement protein [Acidovorax sp. SUPP2825]|uniref:capsid cement protein n=1 Tax=Acidovorax sp. SUPP2825 TaxID=2920879 RepID=UPI0023DE663F|nr:capsid cement protein [Acidovorax sp. SUPP2825]GKS97029.1 DUF2190 family protein [Acidovorax sp. SUPP2825]